MNWPAANGLVLDWLAVNGPALSRPVIARVGGHSLRTDLEPIKRTRVYEEVAARIRRQIADGVLRPGDYLPSERDLAERLGVSRTSVRDAIRTLELLGIVEPRPGEGTIVKEVSPENLVAPLATILTLHKDRLAELWEVRKIIEPPVARRAAERATPEDMAALEEILVRHERQVRSGTLAGEEDAAFHYTLAGAARNQVMLKVIDVLIDLLSEGRERYLQGADRAHKSLEGHRRIVDALRTRDADAAERAMRQHLEEIEDVLFHSPDHVAPPAGD
ncbi:MAG: FadR family transcriptional regulator [Armatimonadetes bacterium]|nr:FadR family transcriptional regulator [Armatimonadota bacterium]